MKGIVFNLLEAFIDETMGEDKFSEIVESCDLKTKEQFVGPGSYPDEDILAIIGRAVEKSKIPLSDFLQKWGKFCIEPLYQKYPHFFEKCKTAKEFLLTVDDIHFTEVVKLYKNAIPPHFTYEDPAPDRLIMRYRSARKLCPFIKGLVEGVAEHYKTEIGYKENKCMLEGDECCEFELSFKP